MIGTPRNYFSVGFPDIPMPVADVWCILARHLLEQKALPEKWTLSGTIGHPLPHLKGTPDYKGDAAAVERILREKSLDAFAV